MASRRTVALATPDAYLRDESDAILTDQSDAPILTGFFFESATLTVSATNEPTVEVS